MMKLKSKQIYLIVIVVIVVLVALYFLLKKKKNGENFGVSFKFPGRRADYDVLVSRYGQPSRVSDDRHRARFFMWNTKNGAYKLFDTSFTDRPVQFFWEMDSKQYLKCYKNIKMANVDTYYTPGTTVVFKAKSIRENDDMVAKWKNLAHC